MIGADRSPVAIAVVGAAFTAMLVVVAVGVGNVWISPADTLRVLADHLLPIDIETSAIADPIVWNIRMPRAMTAVGVGAALGLGGVVLQGLYRNPVADPLLVGLTAVASIGVLGGVVIGWDAFGPVAAVIGGAIAGAIGAAAIRRVALVTEGEASRFILAGIGLGLALSAVLAGIAVALNDPRVPDLPFWFVGSLAAATWGTALWVTVTAIVAVAIVLPLAGRIDIMSLGAPAAAHLGVDVPRLGFIAMAAIGLGVGGAAGAAGAVAFVGLIAGFGARRLVGEHHHRSLVAGFFLGAMLLVVSDAIGRIVGGRFEIPIGLVTAAIGGPFLMWMIITRRTAS